MDPSYGYALPFHTDTGLFQNFQMQPQWLHIVTITSFITCGDINSLLTPSSYQQETHYIQLPRECAVCVVC